MFLGWCKQTSLLYLNTRYMQAISRNCVTWR